MSQKNNGSPSPPKKFTSEYVQWAVEHIGFRSSLDINKNITLADLPPLVNVIGITWYHMGDIYETDADATIEVFELDPADFPDAYWKLFITPEPVDIIGYHRSVMRDYDFPKHRFWEHSQNRYNIYLFWRAEPPTRPAKVFQVEVGTAQPGEGIRSKVTGTGKRSADLEVAASFPPKDPSSPAIDVVITGPLIDEMIDMREEAMDSYYSHCYSLASLRDELGISIDLPMDVAIKVNPQPSDLKILGAALNQYLSWLRIKYLAKDVTGGETQGMAEKDLVINTTLFVDHILQIDDDWSMQKELHKTNPKDRHYVEKRYLEMKKIKGES